MALLEMNKAMATWTAFPEATLSPRSISRVVLGASGPDPAPGALPFASSSCTRCRKACRPRTLEFQNLGFSLQSPLSKTSLNNEICHVNTVDVMKRMNQQILRSNLTKYEIGTRKPGNSIPISQLRTFHRLKLRYDVSDILQTSFLTPTSGRCEVMARGR